MTYADIIIDALQKDLIEMECNRDIWFKRCKEAETFIGQQISLLDYQMSSEDRKKLYAKLDAVINILTGEVES